jgi:hypothetical protein
MARSMHLIWAEEPDRRLKVPPERVLLCNAPWETLCQTKLASPYHGYPVSRCHSRA